MKHFPLNGIIRVKEWSFLFWGVTNVFIRICLTYIIPRHNAQSAVGRFTVSMYSDAKHDTGVLCRPGTSGCFFLRHIYAAKGAVCQDWSHFGFGRRSAGGNGRERLTLKVSSWCGCWWGICLHVVTSGHRLIWSLKLWLFTSLHFW